MKHLVAVLLAALLWASVVEAQCTIHNVAAPVEAVSVSGSPVLTSQTVTGSEAPGFIPGTVNGDIGLGLADATTVTGDFTINAEFLTFFATGVAPGGGLVLVEEGGRFLPARTAFSWGPSGTGTQLELLEYSWRSGTHSTLSTLYTASLTLPTYLRLERSGSSVLAQTSPDGTTWTTAYTATSSGFTTNSTTGFATFNGDTSGGTDEVQMALAAVQINGVQPSLTFEIANFGKNYSTVDVNALGFAVPGLQAGPGPLGVVIETSGDVGLTGCSVGFTAFTATELFEFFQDMSQVDSQTVSNSPGSCIGQTSCSFGPFRAPANSAQSYPETINHGHSYSASFTIQLSATPPGSMFNNWAEISIAWPFVN